MATLLNTFLLVFLTGCFVLVGNPTPKPDRGGSDDSKFKLAVNSPVSLDLKHLYLDVDRVVFMAESEPQVREVSIPVNGRFDLVTQAKGGLVDLIPEGYAPPLIYKFIKIYLNVDQPMEVVYQNGTSRPIKFASAPVLLFAGEYSLSEAMETINVQAFLNWERSLEKEQRDQFFDGLGQIVQNRQALDLEVLVDGPDGGKGCIFLSEDPVTLSLQNEEEDSESVEKQIEDFLNRHRDRVREDADLVQETLDQVDPPAEGEENNGGPGDALDDALEGYLGDSPSEPGTGPDDGDIPLSETDFCEGSLAETVIEQGRLRFPALPTGDYLIVHESFSEVLEPLRVSHRP